MISYSIEPPTFDGETHWPNYHKAFAAAAECEHWSYEEKATVLALSPYNSTKHSLRQAERLWRVAALVTKFGSHHFQLVYTNPLKTRIQHESEILQEYGANIGRLAYPNISPIDT